MSVCLSVSCLLSLVCLSIYLSTYLPIYLSTYLPIYLPTYLSIYLASYLSIYNHPCRIVSLPIEP